MFRALKLGRLESIPRLYAAGELSGFAGINGTSAHEGTFLGPCVVTGRMAARTAVADARKRPQQKHVELQAKQAPEARDSYRAPIAKAENSCIECHDLRSLVTAKRPGYLHFEKSHQRVIDRSTCHAEMIPYREESHRIDMHSLSHHCGTCHLSKD